MTHKHQLQAKHRPSRLNLLIILMLLLLLPFPVSATSPAYALSEHAAPAHTSAAHYNPKATLCRDDNYVGTCETFVANDTNPTDNSIGNDQVSSVKVDCNPSANEVALYVDSDYRGACIVKSIGDYLNPASVQLPNDSISSVIVGSNVKVTLCRDDNYGGTCETFIASDANLTDNSIGNDQVSSVKVDKVDCNPNSFQIALYIDISYNGQCAVKSVGDYPNPASIGLPNDSISSVIVGSSVRALLCKDDNYAGVCVELSSSDTNLSDNSIGNDQVSSAKVSRLYRIFSPTFH